MDLLCPECMGSLVPVATDRMRCSIHGGEFTVLFNRDVLRTMENTPVIPPLEAEPATSPIPTAEPVGATATPAALPAAFTGMRCVQHPSSAATQQCRSCGAFMCATCDFALPDGVHFCPSCATRPQGTLGPKRKRSMIWSYVCAGISTLGFLFSFSLAALHPARTAAEREAMGVLMMFLALVPAIAGLALGLGAVDRRRGNPPSLWIATVWNGVIMGLFLLLCIIGSLK